MAGSRNHKGQSRVQHSTLLLIQKGCLVGVGLRMDAAFHFFTTLNPLRLQMFHCATMRTHVVYYTCLKGLRTQRKGPAQGAALPLRVFWSRPGRINATSCNIMQHHATSCNICPFSTQGMCPDSPGMPICLLHGFWKIYTVLNIVEGSCELLTDGQVSIICLSWTTFGGWQQVHAVPQQPIIGWILIDGYRR